MTGRLRRAALLLALALSVGDCSPPAAPPPRADLSHAPSAAAPPPDGPRPDRGRTPAPTMSYRELDASGFRLIERAEFLPWQHILIFGRKAR
jgi:hypothetical protein